MSLRIFVRALLGIAFVFLALPAVMALAGEATGLVADTSLSGVVVEEHGDGIATDAAGGTVRPYLTLVTATERYGLTGPGLAAIKPGHHVFLRGRLSGGTVFLRDTASVHLYTDDKLSATEAALVGAQTALAGAPTSKRVAVLLINFASATPSPTPSPTPCVSPAPTPTATPAAAPPSPSPTSTATPGPTSTPFCPPPTPTPTPAPTPVPPAQPWTPAQVAGYYFNNTKSVASFYREVSNGSLAVTGDVHGWYTLTTSTSTCDYNGFASAARAAATAAGVDLSVYTNIAYAFPRVSACSWGGLGNVNGPYSWINGTSAMGVYVPTHELGHNFGSHHASSLRCTNASGVNVQYSNNCTASEYGDPFDVMGSNASSSGGIHHPNTWARRLIGMLTTADQQTVTASGTYFVATAPLDGGVPRILRVLRPSGDYYYLEFRRPYGLFEDWATTSPAVNGVMIRIAPASARVQSKLIDGHPATSTFADAPIAVGEKFVDRINDITIIARSTGPAGASVYVQVGPDVTAPSAPASLSASWTGPTTVSLAWTAATDEIGISSYEVRRDGTLVATLNAATLSFQDSAANQATQDYTVTARDAAGNVGPPASVYVGLADTTPPGPPADLLVTPIAAGQAQLTWTAAIDDVGVTGYEVRVDGVVVATVNSPSYSAAGLSSLQTYAFAVAARDAAGNVGAAASALFEMPDLVAPGSPAGLTAPSVGKTSVALAWTAASDDVAVVGYQVKRDGAPLTTVASASFADTAVAPATTYAYSVAAVDGAGNVGAAVSMSVTTIEATPPVLSVPATGVAASGQLDTSAVPITVSWSVSDPSGIALVELQQSRNGGAWSTIALPSATATSVTLLRAPATTYGFRVRATDGVGNASGWSTAPAVKLVARQEASTAITYVGSWTTATAASAYGGALKYAKSSTATATISFTGRSIAWIAPRMSTRGVADVYVDGIYAATVDLYSATSLSRSIVFRRQWSTSAAHTLQLRLKGTVGRPRVDVDAFVIVN